MQQGHLKRLELTFAEGCLLGGISACHAEAWTLPVDISKVRLQLQNKSGGIPKYSGMLNTISTIVREEGFSSLWSGSKPAFVRQFFYSGLRMGMYEPIRNFFAGSVHAKDSSFAVKVGSSCVSGAISAGIFTPTDILKVRMQGAGKNGQQYRGLLHASSSLFKEAGIFGMYKGWQPTSIRAAVVAMAELSTYDQSKQLLLSSGLVSEGLPLHFAASFAAGFFATLASQPIDVVKTNFMNQPIDPLTGKGILYSSPFNCLSQLFNAGGIRRLYQGFIPSWIRLGPWCVIMFMTFEQMKQARLQT
jgi:hypothetical protein